MKKIVITVLSSLLTVFFSSTGHVKELTTPSSLTSETTPVAVVDWLGHVKDDLLPFWDMESAYGNPVGNFPTFRCNDGSILDVSNPCPAFSELGKNDEWITDELNKDYIRMKSRQIFTYGVAFHLTGEPRYLRLAKAGVEYLRKYALDGLSGSIASYWEGEVRHPGPAQPQRTSQDLAYGLQGFAFYYYLTRDETLLPDILRLKDHIIGHYYSGKWNLIRWVQESPMGEPSEEKRKELVALLDQVNAYMLLLAPILPEPFSNQWKRDLVAMCKIMKVQFYSADHNLFWGAITTEQDQQVGGSLHTDFGHSIKTFWMIYMVGKLMNDMEMIEFAIDNGSRLLDRAFDKKSGSWASRPNSDGSLDLNKEWWIYAELDQTAATFSLEDAQFNQSYLNKSYLWWIEHMVDHVHGGVWHKVSYPALKPQYPKVHLWKNGYHSFEHALIGYITDQIRMGRPVNLFYALPKGKKAWLQPYYYSADVISIKTGPLLLDLDSLHIVNVEFQQLN